MARSAHVKNRMHPTDDRLIDRLIPISMLSYEGMLAHEFIDYRLSSLGDYPIWPIWKQVIDMFLSPDELIELTGRRRRDAQVKVMRHMGIQHRIRPNGSLAVLKSHIEKQFDGREIDGIANKRIEPNWSAV